MGSLLRQGYRNIESDSPRQLDFSERAGVTVGAWRRTFLTLCYREAPGSARSKFLLTLEILAMSCQVGLGFPFCVLGKILSNI